MPYKDPEAKKAAKRMWYRTPRGQEAKRRGVAARREKLANMTPEDLAVWKAKKRRWIRKSIEKNRAKYRIRAKDRVKGNQGLIDEVKSIETCAGCGEHEAFLLRVCKVDPSDTERKVSDLVNRASQARILSVIYRRIVLCCNCERNQRVPPPRTTGDPYRWKNRDRIAAEKARVGCVDCGSHDHRHLDFHHIDPSTKKSEISSLVSYGWPVIEREMAKCEVVCANCHIRRHREMDQENAA